MALDILMAARGRSRAIIHTECCVYIHDYSQNVPDSLQDMKSQVQEMADSTPPFGTVLWSWISCGNPGPLWKPYFALIAFWPLRSKLALLLCNVPHRSY